MAFYGNRLFQGTDVARNIKGSEPTSHLVDISLFPFLFSGIAKTPETRCITVRYKGGKEEYTYTLLSLYLYVYTLLLFCFRSKQSLYYTPYLSLNLTRLHGDICRSKNYWKAIFCGSLHLSDILC